MEPSTELRLADLEIFGCAVLVGPLVSVAALQTYVWRVRPARRVSRSRGSRPTLALDEMPRISREDRLNS